MKNLVFPILGILMLGLSGCNDKGDDIIRFPYVPAIFGIDPDLRQTIMITPGEIFLAPDLEEYYYWGLLDEDYVLIADVLLNNTRQPKNEKGYRTVTMNNYILVNNGRKSPIGENERNEDYINIPIERFPSIDSMICFARVAHEMMDVLYTAFYHKSSRYRAFDYEMTYDPDETAEIPTLSVRAKGRGDFYSSSAPGEGIDAFNMHEYYTTLTRDSENKVRINFRFKTGEDEDGNEIWENMRGNPVTITFKKEEDE